MDIKELQDYRLSDAIKFHTHLNPKIWGPDEHLLPEVREKLLAIAADFKEFLGLDLEVKDITISGSNAAYTYTDHSDIDLHLVADLPKADASEIYRELFDAKKYQYNDQHTFKIGGYDVELYVQNANEDPKSQGIYSVLDNKWISVPKRRKPNVDDISVKSKYEDLGRRIEAAVKSGDAAQLEILGKKVREFRQAGLDKTGEFGPENLAFKILRSNGTLDQLRAARLAAKDQAMSLNEKKKKPKSKKRYGSFGGMFFPGYHYYGQTDAAADGGGGDGGDESVKENADSMDTQLQNFVKFCSDRLELEQIPRIRIKRDPEWSRRNNSFGRYIPDADTLIVSVANRHPMDVMRTMAHELTHRKQDEQADMPIGAGDTGSDWENQANAQAGVLMRDFAELHPEYFGKEPISEASGYIPVNKKEAGDPRYSMALTVDIKPGEPQRQAAKMGWKTNPAGTPPTARTNGLVEALTRKLQAVKEGLGFPLVSEQEQELAEVAMSPSALRAFAASPAAEGMQAGFEAELIFTGVNNDSNDSGEMEPDYDMDERASDIDSIMNFFTSGDMSGIDSDPRSNSYRRARSSLEEDYFDWYNDQVGEAFEEDPETVIENWILENDWDQDRQIEEFLREELELSADEIREVDAAMERRMAGKGTAADADLVYKYNEAVAGVREQLELRVTDAMQENNSDYESALDEFRENYIEADESVWLIARGYRYMSDVGNTFDFEWPYWTTTSSGNEEGYNPEAAGNLASSLSKALGVKTKVASGYHSAQRDDKTWIFEPDGSLDGDEPGNMPVEIVSPPMPLSKTLEILPKFFEWATENGAYANDSTGFHMSVSMPKHEGNMLDYTKLALFLGDEYVLKQFGREANTYAKSALQKIREKKGKVDAETVMSAMRKHLDQFASRALAWQSGFGKYTSINPKTNYIEFRSAGGSNYFEDMDKIQNTLMRYARAMDIAFDPDADKPEYAKKLYKLLTDVKTQQTTDPQTGTQRTEVVPGLDNDAIAVFSRFVAGELPKSELKGFIKKIQYGREVARQKASGQVSADYDPDGNYVIRKKESGLAVGPILHRFSATGTSAAIAKGEEIAARLGLPKAEFGLYHVENVPQEILNAPVGRTVPATQTPATDQMTAPAADDPGGNYVLRQREGNEGTGAVLHRFSAPNNMAAVEAARQWTTARGLERRSVWLDHVSGVPLDVLNARPVQATLGEPRPAFREPRTSSIPEVPLDIAQNFQEPPASWDSGSPIVSEPQNFPAARSPLGQWQVVNINTGEVVHEFRATNQQTANQHAEAWQNFTGFDDPVRVTPVAR